MCSTISSTRAIPRAVSGAIAMCAGLAPAHDPELEYVGHHLMDIPGKTLEIEAVALKLTGEDLIRKPVASSAQAVVFEVELLEGNTELCAYLEFADGTKNGAYYVYVIKLRS